MTTRNLILSLVALIWGGAILVATLAGANGGVGGNSGLTAGHTVGVVSGAVLFLAGGRGLLIALNRRN
jgi:hypothetical protein